MHYQTVDIDTLFSVNSQNIYVAENGVNEASHPLTPPKEGVSLQDEK